MSFIVIITIFAKKEFPDTKQVPHLNLKDKEQTAIISIYLVRCNNKHPANNISEFLLL